MAPDKHAIFERALSALGARARRAVKTLGVTSLRGFLRVREEDVKGVYHCGQRTWEEIEHSQKRVWESLPEEAKQEDEEPAAAKPWTALPVTSAGLSRMPLFCSSASMGVSASDLHPSYRPFSPLSALALPRRTRRVVRRLGIATVGELLLTPGSVLTEQPNFGKTSLHKTRKVVKAALSSSGDTASPKLHVPRSARGWSVSRLPASTRVRNILNKMGVSVLGDLHGVRLADIEEVKGCGRVSTEELLSLVRQVQQGEFDPLGDSVTALRPAAVLEFIDSALEGTDARNRGIFLLRLGGRGGSPMTLQQIGERYDLTRERVRQVAVQVGERLKRTMLREAKPLMERLAQMCTDNVCPITPLLVEEWRAESSGTGQYPVRFYVRVLDELWPDIPAWPEGQDRASWPSEEAKGLASDVRRLLQRTVEPQPLTDIFEQLKGVNGRGDLTAAEFLGTLRCKRSPSVTFGGPQTASVVPPVPKTREWAWMVLSEAEAPMRPKRILELAREFLPAGLSLPSDSTLANMLSPEDGFYLLGPHRFGLRKHMRTPQKLWGRIRADVEKLLRDEDRPLSARYIMQRRHLRWRTETTAYELSQILREDDRFADLGRMLFALAQWGVEERELIRDLILEALEATGHPMRACAILSAIQQRRSVSPTSLPTVLQTQPEIVAYGFGYYGLEAWKQTAKAFLVSQTELVDRIVARADPPVTFADLCETLDVRPRSPLAGRLWRTVDAVAGLRVVGQPRLPAASLLHLGWSLEKAVYGLLVEANGPLPLYEIEWELKEKFSPAFDDVGIRAIRKVLHESRFFVRGPGGDYFLSVDLEALGLDVARVRRACYDVLSGRGEILGCDDLLERIAEQNPDIERFSPSMLGALLRSDEAFTEVGVNRFGVRG
ncbi:MAG: sigma factor-like helix-turn-helix DNA-binding protein [Candidatus Brocadiia bacterium]